MTDLTKENVPRLTPESQFPQEAIRRSVQEPPMITEGFGGGGLVFTWTIASAADSVLPWGRNYLTRDRQLRDFWPSESFLAGAINEVDLRNASYAWEIKAKSDRVVEAVTNMLKSAIAGPGDIGWASFAKRFSQDNYTTDNGAFIEIIRDPGMDAGSKFKNERAPVIGIAHLDSNQCMRTGHPETPVIYTDREGKPHKMRWFQIIPFTDNPSPIEKMNGVGFCGVSRILRMAQIARSMLIYMDEKISGRHIKQIHFVSGVSRTDIKDEMTRTQMDADSGGMIRFMKPAILASLDPEKPVSTATIDLASLPDGFDFDQFMRWYVTGVSLCLNVDYQQIAPLASGNIGSSAQSTILHRKSSGKSPIRALFELFKIYGVLPRDTEAILQDRNEGEELERQELRTKAMEEAVMAVNGNVLTPEAAAKSLVRRGIYSEEEIAMIPASFWEDAKNNRSRTQDKNVTSGGNTIREDTARTETGREKPKASDRLRKWLKGE